MSKATEQLSKQKLNRMADLLNPPRITEAEKDLLRSVFGIEPEPYIALRDLFFGFEVTPEQESLLSPLRLVKHLLRRLFLPEVKKEIAFGQNYDLWQSQDMKNPSPELFDITFEAKETLLSMLETSLARLDDLSAPGVDLSIKKSLPFVLARNSYIAYVDSQIRFIMHFVNMDSLSPEDRLNMLKMNSAK